MARLQHIGASQDWFVGEDKTLQFEIYSADEATIEDVSTFALRFRLRHAIESDKVVLTKTTGGSGITISGVFNAAPTTNLQRTYVVIDDTDTDNLQPGKYQYSLWRTDSGNETVIAFGDVDLKLAK
jgi:hypothetical protein